MNDRGVFLREGSAVVIYDGASEPVNHYFLPATQSAVASMASSDRPALAAGFLTQLSLMVVVRPMPSLMERESNRITPRASRRFENFVSWYRNWAQQQRFSREWNNLLEEVWPDLSFFEVEQTGRDAYGVNVVFSGSSPEGPSLKLEFHELSEGERMLTVLYALLAYQKAQPPATIMIDEPDHFVAISELQPWLLRMLDERPDQGQVIVVSHNPEIIRTFGYEHTAWFERKNHRSPTTTRFVSQDDTGLEIHERFRRGWLGADDDE